jgi:hypothetical protein
MPHVFKRDVVSLGFFAGFKWGFPGCLRGPLGLSPTRTSNVDPFVYMVTMDVYDNLTRTQT